MRGIIKNWCLTTHLLQGLNESDNQTIRQSLLTSVEAFRLFGFD